MNNSIYKLLSFGIDATCGCNLNCSVAQPKLRRKTIIIKSLRIPTPEGILLEVGGVATLPDGRIALCTRRGDVWIIENPYMENGSSPQFTLFASGLHEALGLAYHDGSLYAAQRGELTKLIDKNGDGQSRCL